jgi:hypothetical protein
VAIAADGPFGFTIDDILLKGNGHPERNLHARVTTALAEHGVFKRRGVFEVIRDWDHPYVDDDLYDRAP